ncbi:MAG TPA: phosphotransferase [Nocardioidaceae bacterium]|nr:phosphotransferase [Nocardioidaceae bacterium]
MQLDAGSRRLARLALTRFDVTPARLTFVAESFNTVFRVATDQGPFALRIGPRQRIHADGTEIAEQAWQKRLHAHGIPAPRIHPTSDGAASTRAGDNRSCVLLDWVQGRSLRSRMTPASARRLGQLAARLHRDAADWNAEANFDVLRGDQVLYWRVPPHVVTVAQPLCGTLFAEALARAQSVVDAPKPVPGPRRALRCSSRWSSPAGSTR